LQKQEIYVKVYRMQTRLTLVPGKRGTQKYVAEYGERLVCVRYRYDEAKGKRYKTVELIVGEVDWQPALVVPHEPAEQSVVQVQVTVDEVEVRRQVKQAGGVWKPKLRVWEMAYGQAKALGLQARIVANTGEQASN
jgi:hypothetical protein